MQTVNGLMQPGRTAADKRNPAASTTRSWHIEFTPPNSALDQLGLLVQNRLPSEDDSLARFKQNIVPQLEAAYNFARFLSRDADAAQDIVQEAFLRAYRSFAGYRGGDGFSPESGRPSDENSPRPTGEPRTDISIFSLRAGIIRALPRSSPCLAFAGRS